MLCTISGVQLVTVRRTTADDVMATIFVSIAKFRFNFNYNLVVFFSTPPSDMEKVSSSLAVPAEKSRKKALIWNFT